MRKYFCYCIDEIDPTGYYNTKPIFEVGIRYEYDYKNCETGYIKIFTENNSNHILLTHKDFRKFFRPVGEYRDRLIDKIIGTD